MPNKLQAIQAKYTKCQKSSSFKLCKIESKIHKMPNPATSSMLHLPSLASFNAS